MTIQFKILSKEKIKNPVLIEGLPGIGNVGKIAIDFILDNIKANKIIEITSDDFPHSVFVNDKNMIDLPSMSIYYKKIKSQDFLFLTGDIQPTTEKSCYEFCEKLLDLLEKYSTKEIIALGGIGLPTIPAKPKLYCTSNSEKIIKKYSSKKLNNQIFGVVGPIIGVTGLLSGLAKKRNIPALIVLAQTFGHPNYLGIKGAREIISFLAEEFKLNVNMKELDKEISLMDKEVRLRTGEMKKIPKEPIPTQVDTNYIG